MDFKDLSGLTVPDLKKKSIELREELFELKMKNIMGQQVTNPMKIRTIRRDIAKVLTALNLKNEKSVKSKEVRKGK